MTLALTLSLTPTPNLTLTLNLTFILLDYQTVFKFRLENDKIAEV